MQDCQASIMVLYPDGSDLAMDRYWLMAPSAGSNLRLFLRRLEYAGSLSIGKFCSYLQRQHIMELGG